MPSTFLYPLSLYKIRSCSSDVTVSEVHYPSTILPCLCAWWRRDMGGNTPGTGQIIDQENFQHDWQPNCVPSHISRICCGIRMFWNVSPRCKVAWMGIWSAHQVRGWQGGSDNTHHIHHVTTFRFWFVRQRHTSKVSFLSSKIRIKPSTYVDKWPKGGLCFRQYISVYMCRHLPCEIYLRQIPVKLLEKKVKSISLLFQSMVCIRTLGGVIFLCMAYAQKKRNCEKILIGHGAEEH